MTWQFIGSWGSRTLIGWKNLHAGVWVVVAQVVVRLYFLECTSAQSMTWVELSRLCSSRRGDFFLNSVALLHMAMLTTFINYNHGVASEYTKYLNCQIGTGMKGGMSNRCEKYIKNVESLKLFEIYKYWMIHFLIRDIMPFVISICLQSIFILWSPVKLRFHDRDVQIFLTIWVNWIVCQTKHSFASSTSISWRISANGILDIKKLTLIHSRLFLIMYKKYHIIPKFNL